METRTPDELWRTDFRQWALFSLMIFMFAAWYSEGVYHYDEHFQIIEFMSYKLGHTRGTDLAWEFPAQMRSWMQPAVYLGVSKVLYATGLSNPVDIVLALRLYTAFLAWLAVSFFAVAYRFWFADRWLRLFALYLSSCTYFLPVLYVRTSSENFSTIMLLFACATLMVAQEFKISARLALRAPALDFVERSLMFSTGMFCGFAFAFRFQTAFMTAGIFLWLAVIARVPPRRLGLFIVGFALILGLMFLIDRWGYGVWTFSPWNYLDQNLLQGKSHIFGVDPWWGYFRMLYEKIGWAGCAATCILVALFFVTFPLHLFTWIMVPFLLGHFAVGHKELRFLIPAAPFVVVMLPLLMARLGPKLKVNWRQGAPKALLLSAATVALIGNGYLLAVKSTRPMLSGMGVLRYLNEHRVSTGVVFIESKNPFKMLPLTMHYFVPKDLIYMESYQPAYILGFVKLRSEAFYLRHLGGGARAMNPEIASICQLVHASSVYELYKCTSKQSG